MVKQLCTLLASGILGASTVHASEVTLNTDVFPYRLNIDGETTLPQIFFFNTDPGEPKYMQAQVEMASEAGVHIYSCPYRAPMQHPTDEPDFSGGDAHLERFIAIDPKAKFLLRLVLGPDHTWNGFDKKTAPNAGEYCQYADGSASFLVSFGSQAMQEPTTIHLRKVVRHLEEKYPDRVLVYHVGAPSSEFFDLEYREKGPDCSPANTASFQRYLQEYYGDVAALREAWVNKEVTFDTVQVPVPEPGRFPMHDVLDRPIRAFYQRPTEQPWIDYSRYYSKLMSDHIIRWCRTVKEETQDKKLTAAFYGYLYALPGSFAGHYNLEKVLNSRYVDILCSPVDYSTRGVGGPGTFMSPVDSVILHKKLWINEDDTRTHALDREIHGPSLVGMTGNVNQTLGVIDRNIANVLTRGAGIWWMDLCASGMYNSQEVWDLVEKRQPFFHESQSTHKGYSADVQLIVDEESRMYNADDCTLFINLMLTVHTELNRSSATVDTFLLSDYVAGRTPRAELVVFANCFKMSAQEAVAVQERLDKDKSHRVWCYLPAYISDTGKYDIANVAELTGFDVELVPGKIAATGTHGDFEEVALLGMYARYFDLEERPVVSGEDCTIIAKYDADGLPCAAMKTSDDVHSFFFGSPGIGVDCLRAVLKMISIHMWTDRPAVVTKNDKYLFVYTGKEGALTLNVPDGVTLRTTEGNPVPVEKNSLSLSMGKTGAQWFRLER